MEMSGVIGAEMGVGDICLVRWGCLFSVLEIGVYYSKQCLVTE